MYVLYVVHDEPLTSKRLNVYTKVKTLAVLNSRPMYLRTTGHTRESVADGFNYLSLGPPAGASLHLERKHPMMFAVALPACLAVLRTLVREKSYNKRGTHSCYCVLLWWLQKPVLSCSCTDVTLSYFAQKCEHFVYQRFRQKERPDGK